MSYQVMRGPDGRPSILLNEEPPYCVALEAAPTMRESELNNGLWLVMAFAAWSLPDIDAVHTALDAVKHFGGIIKLGLRPFDNPEEHATWLSGLDDNGISPLWLLLSDGDLRMMRQGTLTLDDLLGAIESATPA
jgi:hypothetical protein